MHESCEGCTFCPHLRLLLNLFVCRGREATSHKRGENKAGGVGDGKDMGG